MSLALLPPHLRKYAVEQDYSRYTPVDQAVWRFIMRQLRSYLASHAHPCYVEGLVKTGIDIEQIPHIDEVSARLEKFGWRAVAVSGFIPPAAFMELQSLGFLPVASDMRTLDHLLYTPAPDIVHEAAGHAPILIEPGFAKYLKDYAQVARKSIIGKRDIDQYEAIRVLSDLKENPDSSPVDVSAAEKHLLDVTQKMGEPSEAALLARMNWWTAEYGLIGSLEEPRIYGAGLLSSVGEARSCLSSDVRKLPLTLDCIKYSYDITERQPQLFVTPDFATLSRVLEEFAATMAFRRGGCHGLELARRAESVNTVELDTGLQISGVLKSYSVRPLQTESRQPAYLQFEGPTQLSFNGCELLGHSRKRHAYGFGSPIGKLATAAHLPTSDFDSLCVSDGRELSLQFDSGIVVEGRCIGTVRAPASLESSQGKLIVVTFADCTVSWIIEGKKQILFDSKWGEFDMAVGAQVNSVFGGPADREKFGETQDFIANVIPRKTYSTQEQSRHKIYAEIRSLREATVTPTGQLLSQQTIGSSNLAKRLQHLVQILDTDLLDDWLARLEILELTMNLKIDAVWVSELRRELLAASTADTSDESPLRDGLKLLNVEV